MRVLPRSFTLCLPLLALLAGLIASPLAAAPPDSFTLPEPTPTATPQPEVEGPTEETSDSPPAPATELPATSPEPAETPPSADETPASQPAVVANPVVQALPPEPEDVAASARPPRAASGARPSATAIAPSALPSVAAPSPSQSVDTGSAAPPASASTTGTADDPVVPAAGAQANSSSLGSTHSAVWWILGLIAAALFGVLGWIYTRGKTAPAAVIERPVLAGAAALDSIEDAKLLPTLDILGATRSMMMFTVEYRISIRNRSARAVRDLAVTPQLDSARRSAQGPALAHGTGETKQIERIGPHQSEVISGTISLPVSAIQPILQGNTPLFVPLVHIQLQLGRLGPVTHSFVIGQPSTTSATRLHPVALDGPPGGLPGMQARKLEPQAG